MTIAFGINLGSYALLAADTRTTYYLLNMPFYDDNSSKVQRTTMGLITGAGFCPLLDAVKRRLAEETITHTDQILAIIREERENALRQWSSHRQINYWLDNTGFIFSYFGNSNGTPQLRVATIHLRISLERHVVFPIGEPAIIFPVELTKELADGIAPAIRNSVTVPSAGSNLEPNIRANSTVIASVITALEPYCPSINRRFQVGIHANNMTGISTITDIAADGSFNFNISFREG